ncbi:MAG: Holliday junction resolvase RuvX [Parcubacteria group bacterium]|jgi:putative Holliday junction resolvase
MSIYPQNSAKTSHILGIDFGTAKIGLALADTETRMAFGFDTIKNDKNFLAKLEEIITTENVETVVIGIPGYIHANVETHCNASIRGLAENLKKIGVYVEYAEEMFTSKMAQANLREKGEKRVSTADDKEAARIILQSWLDK